MEITCPADTMEEFNCLDCQQNTSVLNEYYMVNFSLWIQCVPEDEGMLCIGCLETRLGRQLVSTDFIEAPINDGTFMPHSERLSSRICN